MHAHRHHGGQIRGAHDDRDLVTLGHAAAEHREFGHPDLAQRHRRAGHQFIRMRGLFGPLAQVAQRDLRAVVEAAVIGGQQHADHRRQQQAEAGDLHRAIVQRFATGPARRHRTRVAQVAERGQGIEVDAGQRHARATFGTYPEHAGAGGGEEQVVAIFRGRRKGAEAGAGAAVQCDERQALAVAIVDHHRAAGTQFGHRALAADRGRVAEQGRSRGHVRGRGGHRGFHSGDGSRRFNRTKGATLRRSQCGWSSVA